MSSGLRERTHDDRGATWIARVWGSVGVGAEIQSRCSPECILFNAHPRQNLTRATASGIGAVILQFQDCCARHARRASHGMSTRPARIVVWQSKDKELERKRARLTRTLFPERQLPRSAPNLAAAVGGTSALALRSRVQDT
ncbi:hypothetical protein CONPUDRAFT_145785 [Coniophora puteana RWD-64-598 SS2]|uniref:Uncharacterized protein n=1 Tax=Coniophora puteana (strain RWD-64-598) TaxID=741705 RepID=A0A5M3MJ18_CONPW|nr:uncharacterized protein CONPUDRAFT_145785 [Coniophora puteana RWD-64-598 SS2]EIW78635.1 hypothetical protein CONPUDRAFT_145785 [Coniophora puteana RWD-64-598 SS2]